MVLLPCSCIVRTSVFLFCFVFTIAVSVPEVRFWMYIERYFSNLQGFFFSHRYLNLILLSGEDVKLSSALQYSTPVKVVIRYG